jgi:hypothetical protein
VLFCVKSSDTDALARQIAPLLPANALVLSRQNGVTSAGAMAQHIQQTVVPAVVYLATAMPEPGVVKHFGRGDLVIGPINGAVHRRESCGFLRAGVTPLATMDRGRAFNNILHPSLATVVRFQTGCSLAIARLSEPLIGLTKYAVFYTGENIRTRRRRTE